MEENAISSERGLNNNFVEQFAALHTELTTSDIAGWFHADGPGYEYLDEQGIVNRVSVEGTNVMKKRMQTRIHNFQRKIHNALFLVQRQYKCLTIA